MIKINFEGNKSVAYDDNKQIGECDFIENENTWNIVHTEVDNTYQGQGIARKLVECVIENAKKANKEIVADCSYEKRVLERVGMPEAAKILAHAALYVCCSPKSDTVYGILEAMQDVEKTGNIPIPTFLQDSSYKNAYKLGRGIGLDNIHAFPNHYSGKQCMPEELKDKKYFKLSGTGNEKKIQEFLNYLKENLK